MLRVKTSFGGFPVGAILTHKGAGTSPGSGPGMQFGARSLSHAYWKTPLAADAPLAPTSDDFVNRLVTQAKADTFYTNADGVYGPRPGKSVIDAYYGTPYATSVSTGNYSYPIYEVPTDQPLKRVWGRSNKYYTQNGATVNAQKFFEAVPLPNPADMADGIIAPGGNDGSCAVLRSYVAADGGTTAEAWEFWRIGPAVAGTDPAGYDFKCQQGGYIADIRYHPGWWSGSGSQNNPRGGDFGVSASGFAYLGPILTGHDWTAGVIRHPLTVALPATGGASGEPNLVLPATRNDRFNSFRSSDAIVNPFRIPEGTRFRLNPVKYTDSVIAAYAASKGIASPGRNGASAAVLVMVLTALRDYGVIVGDSAGIMGWSAEADKTYGTPYNPYTAAQKPAWGNFPVQLPYADFQQVAVPTIQFHTPGPGPTTPQPAPYDFSLSGNPPASVTRHPATTPAVTLSGVVVAAGGKTDADAFATWRNAPVTVVSDYWGTATWESMANASWTASRHSGKNYLINWAIPLRPRDNTAEPADKTATFQAIARQLIANGQASCIVRLGWEMNGDWFPWAAATSGVAQWIAEYRAAVAAMRSVPGTDFTFEFCVGNRTVVNTPAACWPGDDVVDCVSADVYDWSWATGYTDPATRWNDIVSGAWGLNAIYQLAADHGKWFGIPEWGLANRADGHGGGDDPAFITNLRAWIDAREVWYECYFEKDDSDAVRFKMMPPSTDFPNASATYRSTVPGGNGSTTPPTTSAFSVATVRADASNAASTTVTWTVTDPAGVL